MDTSVVIIDPRPPGGMRSILAEVAAYYDVTPESVLSKSRARVVAHPRQAFMYAARAVKWPDGQHRYSLPQIGQFLGKDHSTILFGVRRHATRLGRENGPQFTSNSGSSFPVMCPELARE